MLKELNSETILSKLYKKYILLDSRCYAYLIMKESRYKLFTSIMNNKKQANITVRSVILAVFLFKILIILICETK